MILAEILLLAALHAAQDPPQGPPPAAEPASEAADDWHDFDQVILVINEDMLTSRSLQREFFHAIRSNPVKDEAERREKVREIHVEHVKSALQVQAGQDMGLDPKEIDRRVKDYIDRRKEDVGSDVFAANLKESSLTLYEFQDIVRDRLYALFWDNYVTGNGTVGQGRQERDRFIRPGYLSYCYRKCLENPQFLSVIGGKEQTVVLQQLFLDPDSAGGAEKGRALAEDLRQRILEGTDMGDLVERYDERKESKSSRGMTEPLMESRVRQFGPGIGEFITGAKPGDVSPVLEYKAKSHTFLRIVRLVERSPAVVPELSGAEVQKNLTTFARKDWEKQRRDQAIRDLFHASYVWPPEYAQR